MKEEVVLSPLASVEPYGRNTTKTKSMLFPLEGAEGYPSACGK
jgi:hypothetical protein